MMKPRLFLALIAFLFLTACGGRIEIGIEHTLTPPATGTQPPVVLVSPTFTSLPPVPTNTFPAPTQPAPTQTSPAPVKTSGPQLVKIFLIGLSDNGAGGPLVGCGDSAIPVQVEIAPTQGVLRAALEKLLSIKDQYYGQSGLYDSLYQSNLQVQSVTINNGVATVQLTGTMQLAGECDNPRVEAQVMNTILQFPTVTSADVFINGKTLHEALSLK